MIHENLPNPLSGCRTLGDLIHAMGMLDSWIERVNAIVQGLQRFDTDRNGPLRLDWANGAPLLAIDQSEAEPATQLLTTYASAYDAFPSFTDHATASIVTYGYGLVAYRGTFIGDPTPDGTGVTFFPQVDGDVIEVGLILATQTTQGGVSVGQQDILGVKGVLNGPGYSSTGWSGALTSSSWYPSVVCAQVDDDHPSAIHFINATKTTGSITRDAVIGVDFAAEKMFFGIHRSGSSNQALATLFYDSGRGLGVFNSQGVFAAQGTLGADGTDLIGNIYLGGIITSIGSGTITGATLTGRTLP